ncbi:MAG: hypothetical protein IKJ18_07965 [Bacteroidaceae bacterium]|nr:hypothetical protein [Bacteroidaceae bacterium]
MKRYIIFIGLYLCAFFYISTSAQNILTTQDGKRYMAYDIIVNDSIVYFRAEESLEAPIIQIHQSEIISIKEYQEVLSKKMENWERNVKLSCPEFIEKGKSAEVNSFLIESYNNKKFTYEPKDPLKIKKAQKVVGELNVEEGSALLDENVSVEYVINSKEYSFVGSNYSLIWSEGSFQYPYEIAFFITVTNRSDSIIYIDLENSFFITGGESYSYFPSSITPKPIVRVEEKKGFMNTLLGVVSKIEESNISTQRIIAISPQSSSALETKLLFPYGKTIASFRLEDKGKALDALYFTSNTRLMDGDLFEWSATNSPVRFSALLTYSHNENFHSPQTIKATFYMSKMYAIRGTFSEYNTEKYHFKAIIR